MGVSSDAVVPRVSELWNRNFLARIQMDSADLESGE